MNRLLRDLFEIDLDTLGADRDQLDILKDSFNEAYENHNKLLETEDEKEASYRYFDIAEREYAECRIRVCERIHALERQAYKTETRSERSSRSSKSNKSKSLSLALVGAATRAAKLEVELAYLEQEKDLKRLQLRKEIALANAEERTIKEFIDEEIKQCKTDNEDVNKVKQEMTIDKDVIKNTDPLMPPFVPVVTKVTKNEPLDLAISQSQPSEVNLALKEIVNLQAKQTELSSLIINQQRAIHLPVKEPPVFSGDPFDFPAFVTAFDSIISANVSSDKDRLYFLEKYTKGKANEVVKGFLAMSSDSAYQEARKLFDHRFGNPVHVAESYKASLRKWPQISDGDGDGLQQFSDFLVRCKEAMKTMQSMDDLDTAQTILQASAKLPSYAGVKWCRHAHEAQTKKKRTVTFRDFAKFVQEESELANDPIYSPDALKRERRKTIGNPARSRYNRSSPQANNKPVGFNSNSFATSAARPYKPSPPSQSTAAPSLSCPQCDGQHALTKCNRFLKSSVDERSETIRAKGLCFGCFKRGHISSKCPSRPSCEECGKRHHTLLHGSNRRQEPATNSLAPTRSLPAGLRTMVQPHQLLNLRIRTPTA
ncbi:hypothetical protein QZH41_005872 [Actinostola sp. cb2023]|nr:hypothetical protein QZH41_005872 [Actinostola sp. cb2023]